MKLLQNNKKAVRVTAVALAAVLVLAGAGVGAWFGLRSGVKVNVYAVSDVAQTDMWMDQTEYEGTVRAENMQAVYLSDTQQLKEIFVKEGDSVKKGDRLAAFDTTLSDLELQRQQIQVQKQELSLAAAKEELKNINNMTPYVPPTPAPEPEPEVLEPVELPYLLRGDGSAEDPYVYLWNEDCLYDAAFVDSVLPPAETLPAEAETSAETEDVPAEAAAGEEDAETETQAREQPAATVIFQVREYDNPKGALISAWGMEFRRQADGGYTFTVFTPSADMTDEEPEEEAEEPSEPEPGFTAADIARLRAEKQQEIQALEMQLKVERLRLKKLELELSTGVVTAELDGVVKTVASEEEARTEGKPVVSVSAGGAWQIGTYIGELERGNIHVGDKVQITSWMEYMTTCEGVVKAISEYPVSGGWYGGGGGNTNVSYYPVTVEADAEEPLQNGDYVSVVFSAASATTGFYQEAPFILSENGGSYAYVSDENGRLEKRRLETGKIYWGSTVEITDGLTLDDYIAFPYGKNVHAGAKAVPSDLSSLYDGWYY